MTRGWRAGLCSVSFRSLGVDAVIDAAAAAGLDAVEWGADVHVPPGAPAVAGATARACADRGLACPSYGSYWFAGRSAPAELDPVLDSAVALGARTVRIWAPLGVGPDASPAARAPIEAGAAAAAASCAARGLVAALEFHPGTLTETATSTVALLDAVGHPALRTYWQPAPGAEAAEARAQVDAVVDRLAHLHVFWWAADGSRRPLAEGADVWCGALAAATTTAAMEATGPGPVAYLEFVPGDDPALLAREAATLRGWLARREREVTRGPR